MAQLVDELPDLLASWLPEQTWFADGNRAISLVRVTASIALLTGEPALDLVLLRVEFADGGTAEDYQLLVGRRRLLSNDLQDKTIGMIGDTIAYDALWDPYVADWLLNELANADTYQSLRFTRELGAEVPYGVKGRVLSEDSIKTTLAYDNECTLKLFRRATPDVNLDLEFHRALRKLSSKHIVQLRAAIELKWDDDPVTLGMLQNFVSSPADGWAMAMVSVRDLLHSEQDLPADQVGGDFAGEAFRLGQAVATTHVDLAQAFGTSDQDPCDLVEAMNARFSVAESTVPTLSGYASRIRAAYAEVRKLDVRISTQRIHGNLHLHNVLRTPSGWLLINFGGASASPLFEKAQSASVLRDVAGMLLSLDHAAHQRRANFGRNDKLSSQLERRADEWSARNRSAFCDGYTEFAEIDPSDQAALLVAYELDSSVYECINNAHKGSNRHNNTLSSISRLTANL